MCVNSGWAVAHEQSMKRIPACVVRVHVQFVDPLKTIFLQFLVDQRREDYDIADIFLLYRADDIYDNALDSYKLFFLIVYDHWSGDIVVRPTDLSHLAHWTIWILQVKYYNM